MSDNKQIKKWSKENAMDKTRGNSIPPSYPNEVMVKIFSSSAYSEMFSKIVPGSKVLDVGCGYGNNLILFCDRGCSGFGIDVTDDMVELAQANLERLHYDDAQISLGSNTEIPFTEDYFDILISVNTLHYSHGEKNVKAALNEFKRVTKPGSKIFIMTAGPEHKIVQSSKRHNTLDWEVLDFGFRTNDRLSFFDDLSHFKLTLEKHFDNVQVGRLTEKYPTFTLDFLFTIITV